MMPARTTGEDPRRRPVRADVGEERGCAVRRRSEPASQPHAEHGRHVAPRHFGAPMGSHWYSAGNLAIAPRCRASSSFWSTSCDGSMAAAARRTRARPRRNVRAAARRSPSSTCERRIGGIERRRLAIELQRTRTASRLGPRPYRARDTGTRCRATPRGRARTPRALRRASPFSAARLACCTASPAPRNRSTSMRGPRSSDGSAAAAAS